MRNVVCLTLALVASASAFVPPSTSSVAKSTKMAAEPEFGVTVETANQPVGGKWLDDASPFARKWFQNAEIKHGRVAMVATIGFMVQKSGVHFPLFLGPTTTDAGWYLSKSAGITFADLSAMAPIDAIKSVPPAGFAQILAAAGLFELTAYNRQFNSETEKVPGDYGYDPLGFTKRPGGFDSDEIKGLRVKELKNGRLAMISIAGWACNELIPGSFPVPHP